MRLQTLATASLATAAAVVVLALGAGIVTWQKTGRNIDTVERLVEVRDGAYRIDVAIRYLNHLHIEPDILRGLVAQAGKIKDMLADETHPRVVSARLHLGEIEALAENALAAIGDPADAAERDSEGRLRPLIEQMRIHESGALEALHAIIDDRNREIAMVVQRSLALLVVIALVVVALGCVVFWIVFFRIRRPLGAFRAAATGFGAGDSSARIALDGNDELADLADLFNRAMEQRENFQFMLQERIKEQRCLYRVLELTTDDAKPAREICEEIVRILPAHLMHEEAAMARMAFNGDEVCGENWSSPASSMRSSVRLSGEDIGWIEVGYSGECPDQPGGEGPFMAEERDLLDSVAMNIARMVQSRRMAERLARTQRLQAVGELTGGVAHDFNNLLTVIQGNAEMLGDTFRNRDDEAAELADMIDSAARRGAELTQRLLAFARRQALEPAAVDVGALLSAMEGLLRRTLGANVELEFKTASDTWPALIDSTQLETAVLNLVVNGRDAMPNGGWLTIEVGNTSLGQTYADSRSEVLPGDYVLVAVSDTGIGIPPDDIGHVFEPFFTTKQKSRGTGLGLSMVYGFVKQSHGHVAIYSEPGEGTTVKLYLPRALAGEIESPPKAVPAGIEGGDAAVLLVEDDDLVRRYTHDLLVSLGYRVEVAGSGPEALEILDRGGAVDLLLTDVVMPGGMSGPDVADAASSMCPGIAVLFMSGYTENAIVHHGRLDPGVKLLSKPFRRRELARKVKEVLAKSSGGGQ
ncbi:MAG: hypothetical protein CMP07_04745 [Xanthomonadales bacterium]|nr:hypothetical protein [Xanthomonadales bacterium]